MAIPPFLAELRALVGTRPLWLTAVCTVVLDDQDRVLLGRRSDTGAWALVGGIVDPGEQPADAAVRECYEETGVHAVPELLTSVTVSPLITYPNGDQTQYLEVTFRCRAVGGEARVNDEESLEVAWFAQDALPELDASNQERLKLALECTGRTAFTPPGAIG
ncbi:NUDIX domain-containing protein [Kitasatospora sp. NBC_01250]|uniref:NUDIX hydrolase n=1 Tax=unclassified Kitasatospora TaxID=2633591 RepID=UPI002E0F4175|nr:MULTISPECIES: NUDIX domain-containing protein [unclassified Kitasatospora]WSJ68413.1 NUDIX domain-containing protein [Kitasatospora sp. NBC_01302]